MFVEFLLPAILTTGIVGLTSSVLLVVVSRIFAVKEDPLVGEVAALLPGANCGGCGQAGCAAFAENLVKTRDPRLRCPVCSKESNEAIGKLLGMEIATAQAMVASLRCKGTHAVATRSAHYAGIIDCHAATLLYQGHKTCPHGCLGLGTCVRGCPFDAIRESGDGIVVVDEDLCTGCGTCVGLCPKGLLGLVPKGPRVFVTCASGQKAADTRKDCSVGCIGCRRCEKACTFDAVHIADNLARIDPAKCTQCQDCVAVCPSHCIGIWHLEPKPGKDEGKEQAA
jgi:Na+-translocating ferredoxin:NAD+ oxidoreductase RNF subunit RnfB